MESPVVMSFGDISPDVKCVSAYQNRLSQQLCEDGKRSYSYRLMLLSEGECRVDIDGRSYRLGSGDLLYFPPELVYTTAFRDFDCSVVNVFFDWRHTRPDHPALCSVTYNERFDPRFLGETVSFTDAPEFNGVLKFSSGRDNITLMNELLREYTEQRRFCSLRLSALLTELFVRLQRSLAAPASGGSSPADLVIDYINSHIDEKLSGELLSRVFSYHPNYLNRLVAQATGCTLHRYIVDAKLRRACYLLSHTDMSVTEIAGRLGFYDSSHFTNVFTSSRGMTPSKYRESYK